MFQRSTQFGWLLLVLTTFSGCARCSLRLPAIDPSGDSVFQPFPSSTPVVSPIPPNAQLPNPAWTTPPQPPACGFPGSATSGCSLHKLCSLLGCKQELPSVAGAEPRLMLSPARLVAPVGSEVILTAGVCSLTGKCAKSEPMEWILSQDSVGNIVDLGSETEGWCKLLHKQQSPRKVSNDYVVARTSAREQLLTRGTANPADDLLIPPGQSWITVTSAVEGVSNITAFAPDTTGWDRRQQTAQIYWIDSQWVFPPPAVSRAGQKTQLSTNVARYRTASPISGWSVLYEIAGGVPAALDAQGTQAIEVPTDANGNATIEVFPQSTQSGATQIRIQVVRPAAANGSLPRLVVGTGYSSVTWSSAGLVTKITGPQVVALGGAAQYVVEISNPGDLPTPGVVATDELPPGLSLVSANPQPQLFGNRLEWNLGTLAPRDTKTLVVNCRADMQGELRHTVRVRSGDGLSAEGSAATRVSVPSLTLEMQGPDTATVGQEVQFRMTVTNRGDQRLTNVLILDRFDPGLRHAQSASPIERSLGDFGPGEAKQIAVTFLAVGAGRVCHTVTVSADGGATSTQQACVNVTAGVAPPFTQPQNPAGGTGGASTASPLRLEVNGPTQPQPVGGKARFTVKATNITAVPIPNVQVLVSTARSLNPAASLPNVTRVQGGLLWDFGQLPPGATATGEMECELVAADEAAVFRANATGSGGINVMGEAAVRIMNAGAGAAAGPTPEDPLPGAPGRLTVTITEQGDPAPRNGQVSYFVKITNERATSDKRVLVSLAIPPGLTVTGLESLVNPKQNPAQPGTIDFEPIAELRPNESFNIKVTATATTPGKYNFRAQATSLRASTPVTAEESTTVLAE